MKANEIITQPKKFDARSSQIVLTIFGLILFIGCDEKIIDPTEGRSEVYSVYSALEVGGADNGVRVRKLDTVLLADSSGFNGTVTFTDLDEGIQSILDDTVINFNGHFVHNFSIDQPIGFNKEYHLKIESDEGEITESFASTPGLTEINLVPNPNETVIECRREVLFSFQNVVDPEFIWMFIGFQHGGGKHWERLNLMGPLVRSEDADELTVKLSPRHLLVEVFTPPLPDNPFFDPKDLSPEVSCGELDVKTVFIQFYHFSKDWIEGLPHEIGNIDIESGRIENGIGFFGGYHFGSFEFDFID